MVCHVSDNIRPYSKANASSRFGFPRRQGASRHTREPLTISAEATGRDATPASRQRACSAVDRSLTVEGGGACRQLDLPIFYACYNIYSIDLTGGDRPTVRRMVVILSVPPQRFVTAQGARPGRDARRSPIHGCGSRPSFPSSHREAGSVPHRPGRSRCRRPTADTA